jgi:hypothetical protein
VILDRCARHAVSSTVNRRVIEEHGSPVPFGVGWISEFVDEL